MTSATLILKDNEVIQTRDTLEFHATFIGPICTKLGKSRRIFFHAMYFDHIIVPPGNPPRSTPPRTLPNFMLFLSLKGKKKTNKEKTQ